MKPTENNEETLIHQPVADQDDTVIIPPTAPTEVKSDALLDDDEVTLIDTASTLETDSIITEVAPSAQEHTETVSDTTPPAQTNNRRILFALLGLGCLTLFCGTSLLGIGGYLLFNALDSEIASVFNEIEQGLDAGDKGQPLVDQADEPTSTPEPETTPTEAISPTATTEPSATPTEVVPLTATPTLVGTDTPTPEPTATSTRTRGTPTFGEITFALDASPDYTPIEAGETFGDDVIELHAIFDYNGMSPDYEWERVWFLDGEELLRSANPWTGDERGRFDYFVDAGGNTLPAGDWLLELYVEESLMISGVFTITDDTRPTAIPQPTNSELLTDETTADLDEVELTLPIIESVMVVENIYQFAYTKWDGGQHNLYLADTNGADEQFILNRAAGPSWSPSGQELYFLGEQGVDRQRFSGGREIVYDGISDGVIALTNVSAKPDPNSAQLYQEIYWKQGSGRWVRVSPDGQMVAYDSDHSGSYRIYTLGTINNEQLPRYELIGEQGDWSPDGQQLVYRAGRNDVTGLWIAFRNDSGHQLITQDGSDSYPAWSPDGNFITFSRSVDENIDLYRLNLTTEKITRLTDTPGPDTLPTYTPDGNLIFRTARTGQWAIWKMDGNGQNQQQVIPFAPVGPDWTFSRMDVKD